MTRSAKGWAGVVIVVSASVLFSGLLVLLFEGRIGDFVRRNVAIAYLGVALSVTTLVLAIRLKGLTPYPLLRACMLLSPGLTGLVASATLLTMRYSPYRDVTSPAVWVVLVLQLIQWFLLPFAVYQVFRK